MAVIVPAILPRTRDDLADKLARLEGIADEVQIDVVDGRFAAPTSWPYAQEGDDAQPSPPTGSLRFEMDVMAQHPERDISRWVEAGANRITIHAEASQDLPRLFSDFKTQYGHDASLPGLLSLGLALNLDSDLLLIEPYLSECEYVQFMGIRDIGRQGQPFDPAVLARISAFREAHPDMPIQVDGGVSLQTAPGLLSAGVSRLIVGSAFWNAQDIEETYAAFVDLTSRYGVFS